MLTTASALVTLPSHLSLLESHHMKRSLLLSLFSLSIGAFALASISHAAPPKVTTAKKATRSGMFTRAHSTAAVKIKCNAKYNGGAQFPNVGITLTAAKRPTANRLVKVQVSGPVKKQIEVCTNAFKGNKASTMFISRLSKRSRAKLSCKAKMTSKPCPKAPRPPH